MSRTQVEIKSKHFTEIKKMVKHSALFNNPEEYLDYVLEELLFSQSENSDHKDNDQLLEKRLRDLGYL